MAQLFSELRERLLRAGVAPRHVRRYLAELSDHLADLQAEEQRAGESRADAQSAALLRLGRVEDLSRAMTSQPRLQSWSARAPWLIFGLAPPFLLAAAYLVACSILWSGWKIFLPGTSSPFVPVHGLASLYFGAGRMLYFGAPILIGWGVALLAARQRFMALWPAIGFVLIALLGATAQVHASRASIPGGVAHVSMNLSLGPAAPGIPYALPRVLVILTLTALPYLLWRWRQAHSLPA